MYLFCLDSETNDTLLGSQSKDRLDMSFRSIGCGYYILQCVSFSFYVFVNDLACYSFNEKMRFQDIFES